MDKYNVGDIVIVTSKKDMQYKYMYGFVFRTYESGNFYMIVLDKGNHTEKFKSWKRFGITTRGAYINPLHHNIVVYNSAEHRTSIDTTYRLLDQGSTSKEYIITTKYDTYLGTFFDKEDRSRKFVYTFITKEIDGNSETAGGYADIVTYANDVNPHLENKLFNKSRYRAEANFYNQFC